MRFSLDVNIFSVNWMITSRRGVLATTRGVNSYSMEWVGQGRRSWLLNSRKKIGTGKLGFGAVKQCWNLTIASIYYSARLILVRFEDIFWIDASNRDTLEQSYKDIALRIQPGLNPKCSLKTALQQLENLESEWLLLLDGADDINALAGLWPPGSQGNIIYTSRNHMLRSLPGPQICKVGEMSEVDAAALLLKSARLDSSVITYKEYIGPILKELGHLALAIDQAGAYIANGQCSIQGFLSTFRNHRRELLQNEAYKGASEYDRAVYATWDLSYHAINGAAIVEESDKQVESGAKIALQILNVFAFFHNENVVEDIFRTAAENPNKNIDYGHEMDPKSELRQGHHLPKDLLRLDANNKWDTYPFRHGIQILLSYSLISQDESFKSSSMHRLVHGWAQDRLNLNEREKILRVARDSLAASVVWRFGADDYTFRRILLPHVTANQRYCTEASSEANLLGMSEFSLILAEAGRWKKAEELQVRVMETTKRVLGEEHPDTLTSMANLASTYRNQGRWKEAEELEVRVMETTKRVLGEEHPSTR